MLFYFKIQFSSNYLIFLNWLRPAFDDEDAMGECGVETEYLDWIRFQLSERTEVRVLTTELRRLYITLFNVLLSYLVF